MSSIEFSREEKAQIVDRIKRYFQKELNQDISGFDAEFLLDFFTEEIGLRFYNQALDDAARHLRGRFEELQHSLGELEKAPPKILPKKR